MNECLGWRLRQRGGYRVPCHDHGAGGGRRDAAPQEDGLALRRGEQGEQVEWVELVFQVALGERQLKDISVIDSSQARQKIDKT